MPPPEPPEETPPTPRDPSVEKTSCDEMGGHMLVLWWMGGRCFDVSRV